MRKLLSGAYNLDMFCKESKAKPNECFVLSVLTSVRTKLLSDLNRLPGDRPLIMLSANNFNESSLLNICFLSDVDRPWACNVDVKMIKSKKNKILVNPLKKYLDPIGQS